MPPSQDDSAVVTSAASVVVVVVVVGGSVVVSPKYDLRGRSIRQHWLWYGHYLRLLKISEINPPKSQDPSVVVGRCVVVSSSPPNKPSLI